MDLLNFYLKKLKTMSALSTRKENITNPLPPTVKNINTVNQI